MRGASRPDHPGPLLEAPSRGTTQRDGQVLRVDPTRDDGLGAAVRPPPTHPWAERATLQGEQLASLGQEGAGSTARPASPQERAQGRRSTARTSRPGLPLVPAWPPPSCVKGPRSSQRPAPGPPAKQSFPPNPVPWKLASLAPCAWRSLSPGLQVPREGKSVARDEARHPLAAGGGGDGHS
ncbi:translation initiation factor IF-2-like [Balaenoptera musculus]|uniref:Translation initiation factor IF-2-like n=1 Tax=Balaenoptera musculus TaxID=9771 RepID=A0A8B8VVZ0_BALMU|nr:translation initiation factor IF-2-like [Balaenoptera musculus]XP_036689082.1 translation initiation factor IF-2-like [Balaenoptera musculus]